MRRIDLKTRGFTIIEILITLAIASVILLIVLLAVPAVRRNARNYERKEAVNFVAAELQSYPTNYGAYPYMGAAATDQRATFINQMKTQGPAQNFDFVYGDTTMSHNAPYLVALNVAQNTVYLTPGHACQRNPNIGPGQPDYPVTSAPLGDGDYRFIAVYTILEPNNAYCIDSQN